MNIRRATEQDSKELSAIIGRVWPEEVPEPRRIGEIIKREAHDLLIAEDNGMATGFVSGFTTLSPEEMCRWELDLLAVLPEYRRQGIAQALIRACDTCARTARASIIRTVVRIDNHPMMAACRRCGYEQITEVVRLMVCSEVPEPSNSAILTAESHFVPVHTLTYSGLWLEGEISSSDLVTANIHRHRLGLDVAGVLISTDNPSLMNEAQQVGYEVVADYCFWIRKI